MCSEEWQAGRIFALRMESHVAPADFLLARNDRVVLDVRSPKEYQNGHIPGACSFPLFSDEERTIVGTLYKQKGKEEALLEGLKIVGPKMEQFVRDVQKLAPQRRLAVHCWRGGQRSQSMAWLFRQAGFDVITLAGGYKEYRRHLLVSLENCPLQMIVIGGQTGTGKTKILHQLQQLGEQIIDLEALAHHKGSAFGSIGELPQPTVEQFENVLFEAMQRQDPARRVWLENESRSIGRVFIPEGFWKKFKASSLYNIEVPFECRIKNLVEDYTGFSSGELEAAFQRIEKKLGGQHLKAAVEALQAGDYATAAAVALRYYDKTYRYGLENNNSPDIRMMQFDHADFTAIARECLRQAALPANGKSVPLAVVQQ